MRIAIATPQDALGLLIRRKWLVIFPFIALSCVGVLLTKFLPNIYVSTSLILVQPRDVPKIFVMDLITGSAQQRLSTIQQTILSRTNLIQILREFENDLIQFEGKSMDEKVSTLRNQININFQLDPGATPSQESILTSFRISYQNQNPTLAQQVTTRLTALFIEQDNRVRETQVFGTTEFLATELQKTSDLLLQSSRELSAIRSLRQYELPEQLDTNLRTLDRLGMQQQANSEAMDRYVTMRLNIEAQMSETLEMIPQSTAAQQAARAENPLVAQYRNARMVVELAEARYTAEHPALKIAKADLDILLAQIPPEDLEAVEEAAAITTMVPNPGYQGLTRNLEEVKTELAIREREKEFILTEIQKYSGRVENTPIAEQEMAELVRRTDTYRREDANLRADLAEARLAESLESRQRGSQFVIIDPANLPLAPSKPDKQFLALAVVGGSLGAALALAAAVDILRQRVWTATEIETFWGAPVLVDIPQIVTDSDLARQKKRKFMFAGSSFGAAIAYALCLYMVYLYQEPIIQQLNPLLQRFVYN